LEVVERVDARPGEEVAHVLSIVNRGGAGEFLLNAFDDRDFELDYPRSITLAAGEASELPLTLQVPDATELETVQTLTVVLRSASQPELYTYVVIRTRITSAPGQDMTCIRPSSTTAPRSPILIKRTETPTGPTTITTGMTCATSATIAPRSRTPARLTKTTTGWVTRVSQVARAASSAAGTA